MATLCCSHVKQVLGHSAVEGRRTENDPFLRRVWDSNVRVRWGVCGVGYVWVLYGTGQVGRRYEGSERFQ